MSNVKRKQYLPAEVDAMRADGFITPREAAEQSGFSLAMVYRAMKQAKVHARLGAGGWALYVGARSWTKFVDAKRASARRRLGIGGAG